MDVQVFEIEYFWVPSFVATINLELRRTLVRSELDSTFLFHAKIAKMQRRKEILPELQFTSISSTKSQALFPAPGLFSGIVP